MEKYQKVKDMFNKYNIIPEILDPLTVYQLRVLGQGGKIERAVTLKREELIEQLMKLKKGEIEPHTAISGKGKPSKSLADLDGVLAFLETKAIEYNKKNERNIVESCLSDSDEEDSFAKIEEKPQTRSSVDGAGVLEIMMDGYGFLRGESYYQSKNDIFVPANQIRAVRLRRGDYVVGKIGKKAEGNDFLLYTNEINGMTVSDAFRRPDFSELKPIYPNSRLKMEIEGENNLGMRMIDLLCPIGKGQRALIVSPPKAGKTTIIKDMARSIRMNNKEVKLFILLVDERPEEVTDIRMSSNAEVIDSTFDKGYERHAKVAELLLSHAKRLVETGQDVCILLDSITRLSRAYNYVITPTGRSLSGGLDVGALQMPKKFFGAARNVEGKGSLTIIATALVDTGSKMDDIIYEEFKGTGNMELMLDRNLAEKRIFPAIDLAKSGTRMENLLLTKEELEAQYKLRRMLAGKSNLDGQLALLEMLDKTKNNTEFVQKLPEWLRMMN